MLDLVVPTIAQTLTAASTNNGGSRCGNSGLRRLRHGLFNPRPIGLNLVAEVGVSRPPR